MNPAVVAKHVRAALGEVEVAATSARGTVVSRLLAVLRRLEVIAVNLESDARVLSRREEQDANRESSVHALWPLPLDQPATTHDLLAAARGRGAGAEVWRAALTAWLPPVLGADLPTPKALGYGLRTLRGKVVSGYVLDAQKKGEDGVLWVRRRA